MHQNKTNDFYLYVQGERIPVTEKVYRAYYQAYEQERYRENCAREQERSREALSALGVPVDYHTGAACSAEDDFFNRHQEQRLTAALAQLTPERREHLQALLLGEMSERALAEHLGLSRAAVHKRKLRDMAVVRAYLNASEEDVPRG